MRFPEREEVDSKIVRALKPEVFLAQMCDCRIATTVCTPLRRPATLLSGGASTARSYVCSSLEGSLRAMNGASRMGMTRYGSAQCLIFSASACCICTRLDCERGHPLAVRGACRTLPSFLHSFGGLRQAVRTRCVSSRSSRCFIVFCSHNFCVLTCVFRPCAEQRNAPNVQETD